MTGDTSFRDWETRAIACSGRSRTCPSHLRIRGPGADGGERGRATERELAYAGSVDGEAPDTDAGDAAERLRQLRTSLNLSQEQLAHRLGVSFATVNRWESGRTRMSPRAERALVEFEARATASSP